jgi:hypothetical protein
VRIEREYQYRNYGARSCNGSARARYTTPHDSSVLKGSTNQFATKSNSVSIIHLLEIVIMFVNPPALSFIKISGVTRYHHTRNIPPLLFCMIKHTLRYTCEIRSRQRPRAVHHRPKSRHEVPESRRYLLHRCRSRRRRSRRQNR